MNEDELAEAADKTRRTIRRRTEQGVIVKGPDGLYDLGLALEQLRNAATGAGRPRKADGDESDDGKPSQKRRERIDWNEKLKREQARKARLERMELQGALVRRSSVASTWAEQATQVRDQLMHLGPRMADRLAAESDPRVCSQIVLDEVVSALRALAGGG